MVIKRGSHSARNCRHKFFHIRAHFELSSLKNECHRMDTDRATIVWLSIAYSTHFITPSPRLFHKTARLYFFPSLSSLHPTFLCLCSANPIERGRHDWLRMLHCDPRALLASFCFLFAQNDIYNLPFCSLAGQPKEVFICPIDAGMRHIYYFLLSRAQSCSHAGTQYLSALCHA